MGPRLALREWPGAASTSRVPWAQGGTTRASGPTASGSFTYRPSPGAELRWVTLVLRPAGGKGRPLTSAGRPGSPRPRWSGRGPAGPRSLHSGEKGGPTSRFQRREGAAGRPASITQPPAGRGPAGRMGRPGGRDGAGAEDAPQVRWPVCTEERRGGRGQGGDRAAGTGTHPGPPVGPPPEHAALRTVDLRASPDAWVGKKWTGVGPRTLLPGGEKPIQDRRCALVSL